MKAINPFHIFSTRFATSSVTIIFVSLMSFTSPSQGSQLLIRTMLPADHPEVLIPHIQIERNLLALSRAAPAQLTLELQPWTGVRWALNTGLLARRYADPEFSKRKEWQDRHDYSEKEQPISTILLEKDPEKKTALLDILSPAEKYDLLVGDPHFTLTRAQWAEGERYRKRGTLADWMGICEGSAAASVVYHEPQHSVELLSPNGLTIRFHPLDIKGLASLLWSSYNVDVPIVGTRCKDSNFVRDQYDIITDSHCFNPNPASFHLAILNLLGTHRMPVFMNRVMYQEVWNVPIVAYNVEYFPLRGFIKRTSPDPEKALTPLSKLKKENYFKYRSHATTWVVGVKMTVTYPVGHDLTRNETTATEMAQAEYTYDLELNANGVVIGGEWREEPHPDFLWAIDPSLPPLTLGDRLLANQFKWDGSPISFQWLPSVQAASRSNQPLELIVRKLIELSRN